MRAPCTCSALLGIALCLGACNHGPSSPSPPSPSAPEAAPRPTSPVPVPEAASTPAAPAGPLVSFPLPEVLAPASLDYLAFEPGRARVWVPEGTTGSVNVFDSATQTFARVAGFAKAEREVRGKKRTLGPNAVAIGDGTAYVGDRATGEVCPVDAATLEVKPCVKLAGPSDGVAYVASKKEVWVTVPRDRALVVLDASRPSSLVVKTTVTLEGAPEGYASDPGRGLFFTNLEDRNATVALDLATHKPTATWRLDCGPDGPRGLVADPEKGFVLVACTDHLVILDEAHGGATAARLDVGAGIDNIDWLASRRLVYVAAAKGAKAIVARVDDHGQPTVVASMATPHGARNGVSDEAGRLYLADPENARLDRVTFPLP